MRKKQLKAYLTIEMSFLIPMILLLFVACVMLIFYFHDKDILNGAAYEAAVTGSLKIREEEEFTEEDLIVFCRKRIKGKCFFLTSYDVDASILEDEVLVEVFARKKGLTVSVSKKAAITEPEKKIRNIRRFDIKDGEKNND